MGNKYGSNIRTYTARNLIWDVTADQPVPLVMNAPSAFTVPRVSMLKSFYKAQFDLQTDWNRESKVCIKRAGIFCNFADGLVQKMDTSRITMTVRIAISEAFKVNSLGVQFVAGSNEVNGANLITFIPGDVIYDTLYNIPYYVQTAASGVGQPLYITDYARESSNLTDVYAHPPLILIDPITGPYYLQRDFTISNVATLNTMYESEIFFPYCPLQSSHRMFLSCFLGIDGADSSLDFYTKTIDTDFNSSPVSFDSVIELEITPS